MDDLTVEDEKKRFEPEVPNEEDTQPDPDEELMLDRGNGRVWLVKVSTSPTQFIHEGQHYPHMSLKICCLITHLMLILKDTEALDGAMGSY